MKQSRRQFMKQALAATTATALLPQVLQAAPKRPNILWLSCEDISPHLGCFGEKFAITPNIDAIAAEGVRYTRAFTVHGVCAPSRSGIITGVYPSSLGSVNMRCKATKPASVKCFTEYLRDAGYYCTNNSKEDYNFTTPKSAWDESSKKAHWKNRPDGKPFFAVFNYTGTHESKLWDSADFDNTHPARLTPDQWQKPENMKVPPIYPDVLPVRRDFARLFERITEFDYYVQDKISELKEAGLYEETIIFIWSDHGNGLPRAKRWLYDSGTLSPIIVRIPNQFRTGNQAAAGTAADQLVNFIDLGPTVLNLAGLDVPGYMHGQTFLGSKLPPQRKYIFGARQRIDEFYDMVRSVRDKRYRYIRNFMPFLPYLPYLEYAEKCNTMKAMRTLYAEGKLNPVQAQWMADHRPAEELYDLEADPWETTNLAGKPEYVDVHLRLRKTLEDWMVETLDTGLLPEPEMLRLAKECGGEYCIFHQPMGGEQVEKLLDLAVIASDPKADDKPQVIEALKDADPVARYWAVLAMRSYAPDSQKDMDKLLAAANDGNACVRIAAAWALSLCGQGQQAVTVLEKEITSQQDDDTLQFALKVLDCLGPESKAAMGTVQAIMQAKKNNKYVARIGQHFIDKYKE